MAKPFHFVEVFHRRLALGHLVQHFVKTLVADTARSTLAAGLVHGKLKEEFRDVDHAVVLVHDDKSAAAHHRADCDKVIVVDRRVDERSRDTSAGRTAGLSRLELFAVGNAPADFFDNRSERSAHRNFDKTGVMYLTAEREHLGALALLGTH